MTEESEAREDTENTAAEVATAAEGRMGAGINRSESRHRLLCALKPYVSKDRGRALDSMEAIANILEMIRS